MPSLEKQKCKPCYIWDIKHCVCNFGPQLSTLETCHVLKKIDVNYKSVIIIDKLGTFLYWSSKILKFHEILTFVGSFWLWEPLHQWPCKVLCEALQWQKVCQCTRKWQPSFRPHPWGAIHLLRKHFFLINHNIFTNFVENCFLLIHPPQITADGH